MFRPAGLTLLLAALALPVGCASNGIAQRGPITPSPIDYGLRVFSKGAESDMATLLETVSKADYIVVGETHLDDQTHRLEHTILQGVLARRGAEATILSMEMFTRDQQRALDAYVAGTLDEAAFLEQAPPWSNYRTAYRPLVETAKRNGFPVVGANLPRSLQRAFGMKKSAALDELTPEQRAWFPTEIHPPTDTYWARVESRLRDAGHGHMGALDAQGRKWSTQNLWDNTMADAMVQAREAKPGAAVVHVVGGFHAEHGDGIANQLRLRDPDATIEIVTIDPVFDLRGIEAEDGADRADFVIYALADARGFNSGTHGITVHDELKYRLAAPTAGEPKGLLIWLGDDETSPKDALTYWKTALGDEVMIAVVEPTYPVLTGDARVSGRWTWPSSLAGDTGRVVGAIDRMADYLGHRWQIPEGRIVVAGRGSGADVALWAGLYGESPNRVFADQPRSPERLAEAGIPDKPPNVVGVTIGGESKEMAGARKTLELAGADPEVFPRITFESELRNFFGLPSRDLSDDTPVPLRIATDTPIAVQWARLHARLAERGGAIHTVVVDPSQPPTLTVDPATFREGKGLPLAPGAFGGTTILVLPATLDPAVRDAWAKLGEDDVLKKRSRFATLVVVDDGALGPKLDELREKGKRSMLIVPAAFAVGEKRMKAIQALVQPHEEGLDVHYLPGLGGSWASSLAADG
ncbi:MAG: ChaN family lipoprotein [Nannocystaceae bacterium]|nr:ChaN family lipoprotein [Nannocystaceae bacterium]